LRGAARISHKNPFGGDKDKMTEKPVCFVIAPIGEAETTTRHRSERVYEDVLKVVAKRCKYKPLHAMYLERPGLITTLIIQHVVTAPLVIADLTDANANVFYELALRHAARKPVIQIMAKAQEIPFDLQDTRIITFDIDVVSSRKEAIGKIVRQIKEMEKSSSLLETPVSVAGVCPLRLLAQGESLQLD
jgi:hypothetical protein